MRLLHKHTFYYVGLLAILAFGLLLIFQYQYDRQLQMMMVVFMSMFYVGWGVLHHKAHHDLTAKIVVEYILIGSLGMSLVLFLLKNL